MKLPRNPQKRTPRSPAAARRPHSPLRPDACGDSQDQAKPEPRLTDKFDSPERKALAAILTALLILAAPRPDALADQRPPTGVWSCRGVELWGRFVDGDWADGAARPARWIVTVRADGRATGVGLSGRARVAESAEAPLVEARWAPPPERDRHGFALRHDHVRIDPNRGLLSGVQDYAYLRAPFDVATVEHRIRRDMRARCVWSPAVKR